MKSFIKLIFLSLFILASCKQTNTSNLSSGTPRIMPGSCSIGKWSNLSSPVNLKMSSDFNGDFTNADLVGGLNPLEQMAKAWNDAVSPTPLLKVPFETTATSGNNSLSNFRDNELGIYKSYNWFSNVSSNALAITQFYGIVRSDGSLGTYIDLTHADIIVNYRDFASDFTMTGNPMIAYDLPTVVLHEMGHFLGLCHEVNADSIMAPYYFTSQRNLRTFDTNKIKALYQDNQNLSSKTSIKQNAISNPIGTEVTGIIELNANGHCRHFVNGKLVYEHN